MNTEEDVNEPVVDDNDTAMPFKEFDIEGGKMFLFGEYYLCAVCLGVWAETETDMKC